MILLSSVHLSALPITIQLFLPITTYNCVLTHFQAGLVTDLNSDSLILALEPEAASVWCKKLPSDGFIAEEINEDTLEQTPGTKYMVVDCGGMVIRASQTIHNLFIYFKQVFTICMVIPIPNRLSASVGHQPSSHRAGKGNRWPSDQIQIC